MDKINELEQRVIVLEEYVKKQKRNKKITLIVSLVLIALVALGYYFLIKYFIDTFKSTLGSTDIFNLLK